MDHTSWYSIRRKHVHSRLLGQVELIIDTLLLSSTFGQLKSFVCWCCSFCVDCGISTMLRLSTPFRRMVYDLFSRLAMHTAMKGSVQDKPMTICTIHLYNMCVWPSHVFPHFCRHIPMPVCLNSLIFRDWKPKPLGYVSIPFLTLEISWDFHILFLV